MSSLRREKPGSARRPSVWSFMSMGKIAAAPPRFLRGAVGAESCARAKRCASRERPQAASPLRRSAFLVLRSYRVHQQRKRRVGGAPRRALTAGMTHPHDDQLMRRNDKRALTAGA